VGRRRARRHLGERDRAAGSITTNGGHSEINSVSCATGNYCVAVGERSTDQSDDRAIVDVDLFGTWQQVMSVPGLEASSSQALSVSCPSVGNCTVGGWYRDASNQRQAFVEDEVNGTWESFQPPGGLADLNTGEFAEVDSVSCGTPRNCTATGNFATLGGTLPGGANQGVFGPQSSVSCWSAGKCATGRVVATSTGLQARVSVESPAASASLATNTATVKFGQEQLARCGPGATASTRGRSAFRAGPGRQLRRRSLAQLAEGVRQARASVVRVEAAGVG
jgi:hypothetical protein